MKSLERVRGVAAWTLLLLAVAFFSWRGTRGPGRIELHLGPGDSPYVQGFLPYYEVEGRRRTHWTTYAARVELPLSLRGGPVVVSYRYARDFPQTAEVEVQLSGRTIDRFSARGGVFQERSVELAAVDEPRLDLQILADSHERRNMGLKLEWIRIDYGDKATVRLSGVSLFRPLLLVVACLLGLRLMGWSSTTSFLLCAGPAMLLVAELVRDPWLVHRLLTGLVAATVGYLVVALAAGWALVRWASVSPKSRRLVTSLAFGAFLFRALLVSHPDFYYPDLRTHATLAGVLQGGGFRFLVNPSFYIQEHGKWVTDAYGQTYAFPYTPAFHLFFALFPLSYDATITWMKLVAAAFSTVPIVLVWAMARRFHVSVLGSVLAVLIPTYTSRLSFAFLPSLFGHCFDVAFLLWLSANIERLEGRRVWIGAGLVAATQLAYVSGVLNISVLLGLLVLVELVRRGPHAGRRALAVSGMLAGGALLSFALFYRDFLPMVTDVATRAAGGAPGAHSRYPVESFFRVAYDRTRGFFGALYPLLSFLAVPSFRGRGGSLAVLWAWGLAYLALLFGRAKMPDIFTHGHETLFVTPLVCLLAGATLGNLWAGGGLRRVAAALLLAVLAGQGLYLQWQAIAAQLY